MELIDIVVLKNLVKWGDQLKESDYMSNNIKEGLIKAIFEAEIDWSLNKAKEIIKSSTLPEMKKLDTYLSENQSIKKSDEEISRAIEIIGSLLNNLNQDEKAKFKEKLIQVITIDANGNWLIIKQIIEVLIKIAPKMQITEEETKTLINKLKSILSDQNLRNSAIKAISSLINLTKNEVLAIETLVDMIKLFNHDNVRDSAINCLFEILKNAETKILQETLNKIITYFADDNPNVRKSAI